MLKETKGPVVGTWFRETAKSAVAGHVGWLAKALWLVAAGLVGWIVGMWSV